MKLQQIRRNCMANKRFVIVNAGDGGQWLSDGLNYYRLVGMQLSESLIPNVFDLTDKQMGKMIVKTEERGETIFCQRYHVDGQALYELDWIWMYDQRIMLLDCEGTTLYVTEAALKAGSYREWSNFYLVRDVNDEPMVALFNGVFCDALLSPLPADIARKISDRLTHLGDMPTFGLSKEMETEGLHAVEL